jgi:hypothetical protein
MLFLLLESFLGHFTRFAIPRRALDCEELIGLCNGCKTMPAETRQLDAAVALHLPILWLESLATQKTLD